MSFSYTGLAFLLGSFAVGLLSYRFFQYWRKEKTVVSKIFFYFAATFALFMIITAVGALFFAESTQVLRWVVILAALIQSFGFAFIVYLIFYLKFPRISPWWGSIIILILGLITAYLTATTPFSPYLEPSGGINWDIQHSQPLIDIFMLFLFVITFLPLIIIFIQQFKTSADAKVKARAFGLGLVMVFGILTSLLDFLLETVLKLGATSSDIAMSVLSVVVIILIIFSQKPPQKEEEKPVSSSERITW